MFDVSEDGTIIYDGDTDLGPSAADGPGSLFVAPGDAEEDVPQAPAEDVPPSQEAPAEDVPPSQEAPADAGGDAPLPELTPPPADGLTGSGNSASLPTGSGNTVYVPVAVPSGDADVSLTTSGDVYIYPELPDAEPLAEARSATAANVDGLPNATSLAYLEDVASGYPSWYKYMAFKTDSNYSQSMALWIAPEAQKSPSQDRIEFSGGVDCIEVRYVRSGSTSYYQYVKSHYGSYSIPYDADVFLSTNVVDGYARLDLGPGFPLAPMLFGAAALAVVSMIFRGGAKT